MWVSFPSSTFRAESSRITVRTFLRSIPAALRAGASEVSLDGIGLVHFSGADGEVTERTRSAQSARRQDEHCFILADAEDRDEHGWQIYHLCMLEPSA